MTATVPLNRDETSPLGSRRKLRSTRLADAPPQIEEVRNISKRFGAVKALTDVSLSLAPGRVRALLGENGAGKSTLVKCIMGTYRPDT